MSLEKCKTFYLFFYLICTNCQHEQNFHFLLGYLFSTEGDFILLEVEQINLSHKSCQNWKNFVYIDFNFFYCGTDKNILDKNIPKASDQIAIRKGTNFIGIKGFFPTRICL